MPPSISGLGALEKSLEDRLMADLQQRISDSFLASATTRKDIANHSAITSTATTTSIPKLIPPQAHDDWLDTLREQSIKDLTNAMAVPNEWIATNTLGDSISTMNTIVNSDPPANLVIHGPNGEEFLRIDAHKKEIFVSPEAELNELAERFLEVCQIEIEDYSYASRVTELEKKVAELEEENRALEEAITQEIQNEVDGPKTVDAADDPTARWNSGGWSVGRGICN